MNGLVSLYRASIGKKAVMAVTGFLLIGFVLMHMYGNLKAFQGAEYFNHYAEGLREIGAPIFGHTHLLWVMRLGLIAAFVLHIASAIALSRQSAAARPVGYASHKKLKSNLANLTIRWGGLTIALFVIYHLMHFTFGVKGVHPDFIHGDAYHNLVVGFQVTPVTFVYMLAVLALGMHLYHGTWSMIQTLGWNRVRYEQQIKIAAAGLAVLITVGFLSVPIGVLAGIIN